MSDDPKSWYRDSFMISTAQQLIQLDAVNEAMGSDMMYWAKKMEPKALKKMLGRSLCFGLYELPEGASQVAGKLPSCALNTVSPDTHLIPSETDLDRPWRTNTNRLRSPDHGRSLLRLPHRRLCPSRPSRQRSRQMDPPMRQ